jgi:hypothetical protein
VMLLADVDLEFGHPLGHSPAPTKQIWNRVA